MTASEFFADRHALPDGGRWTELVRGTPKMMQPPDQKHGDVVRNLSRLVAQSLMPEGDVYAGFEIGVQTRRDPDTVRFPAISLFTEGNRFSQIDSQLAEQCPRLVIEIVSGNDRRTTIAERVYEYHSLGIRTVWVIDPIAEQVTILRESNRPITSSENERLSDFALLPDFEIRTRSLFLAPDWWHD